MKILWNLCLSWLIDDIIIPAPSANSQGPVSRIVNYDFHC